MRLLSLLSIAVLLNSVTTIPGQSETTNTAPLRGGMPFNFAKLPPLPPNGFYAWCETTRGICKVKGNAPIAPASACHCAEFTGQTT